MKNIGSTLSIILGILIIFIGLSKASNGGSIDYMNSGMQMLLGAVAYKWAKKRKYGEIPNTSLRKVSEGIFMFFVISITIFRNDLALAVSSDPVPNLIIPAWVVIAYLVVVLKKNK